MLLNKEADRTLLHSPPPVKLICLFLKQTRKAPIISEHFFLLLSELFEKCIGQKNRKKTQKDLTLKGEST